ncbi:hypothetical protein V1478_014094, partial [Vespula squamosa]
KELSARDSTFILVEFVVSFEDDRNPRLNAVILVTAVRIFRARSQFNWLDGFLDRKTLEPCLEYFGKTRMDTHSEWYS